MPGAGIQQAGKLAIQVGGPALVTVVILGAPPVAIGAAAVAVAAGGGVALVYAGRGIYKLLSSKKGGK